jgi:hypothetical protein
MTHMQGYSGRERCASHARKANRAYSFRLRTRPLLDHRRERLGWVLTTRIEYKCCIGLCKQVLVTECARAAVSPHIRELTTVTMPIKHLESVYLSF